MFISKGTPEQTNFIGQSKTIHSRRDLQRCKLLCTFPCRLHPLLSLSTLNNFSSDFNTSSTISDRYVQVLPENFAPKIAIYAV